MNFGNKTSQLFTFAANKEGGTLAMKRLLVMFIVAVLITTQFVSSAQQLSVRAQIGDAHTLYLVGLSAQTTITIHNPQNYPITVTLTPFMSTELETVTDAQAMELPAGDTRELAVTDLPAGTVTVRLESSVPFDAYAYERPAKSGHTDLYSGTEHSSDYLEFPATNQTGSANEDYHSLQPN
jgi:hypothetical protein